METIVETLIARGWFESRGVRHIIDNPNAFRETQSPLLLSNILLLHKRGTYNVLDAFLKRRALYSEMNMTMFSAFCSCERERLIMAMAILEKRIACGECILHPLPCLIKLMRAIEHKFLYGQDKQTYLEMQWTRIPEPRRTRTW